MPLIWSCAPGQEVLIGDNIRIRVLCLGRRYARVSFDAPPDTPITPVSVGPPPRMEAAGDSSLAQTLRRAVEHVKANGGRLS